MNALAWILATTSAAAGVDYGWQPSSPGGELEYVIQIEPALMQALQAGEEITSEIPPELAGVRRFRIRVGNGPVPRIPLTSPRGAPDLSAPQSATLEAQNAAAAALGRQGGSLDGLPPPPRNSAPPIPAATAPAPAAGAGTWSDQLRTTPNPFGPRPETGDPASSAVAVPSQLGQALDETNRWDPRAPLVPLADGPNTLGAALNPADPGRAGQLPSLGGGQPIPATTGLDDGTGQFQNPSSSRFSDRYRDLAQPQRAAETLLTSPQNFPADSQSLPPRPQDGGGSASLPANALPPLPDMSQRFRETNRGGFGPSSPAPANSSARNGPWSSLPGFGPENQVPSATITRDSRPFDAAGLAAPRPLTNASFDQPANDSVRTGAFQMEKPTLPEELAQQPYKPWGWFIAVLFGLMISVSANFYLGWIAWDLHRRYRSAVLQMTDAAALGV